MRVLLQKTMAQIQFTNSLTRKKEVFEPLDPTHIRLYACGPTVYDYAHLGNARMAVIFDLLRNVLETRYEKVTYVSNITDIDDKIMTRAKETGKGISDITKLYTAIYNEDMAALGNRAPTIQPHATDHVAEMIAQIEQLIDAGHAYESDGHVLFHVPSFPKYGGLSGRSRDEQIAGARVEVASYKKDAADFVLWKPSSEDEPGWPSPWGRGRPGWHIECSVMSEKHLGLPFDIHGGGADLKFPHHENEIAQSCCAHGNEGDLSAFAKTWIHNGFLTVEGEKMSKSLGNFTLIRDVLDEGVDGIVIRLALLSASYKKPLDWSKELISRMEKMLVKTYSVLERTKDLGIVDLNETHKNDILAPLYNDLNTPEAFANIHRLIADLNRTDVSEEDKKVLRSELLILCKVLGLKSENASQYLSESTISEFDEDIINSLVIKRNKAKKDKDYARADALRDELKDMGIALKDGPEGTTWERL